VNPPRTTMANTRPQHTSSQRATVRFLDSEFNIGAHDTA